MTRPQSSAYSRKRGWTVAFFVWLAVVWGHSLLSGELSAAESSRFVFLLRPLFALFGNTDEQLMTFVIRKGAHFSEYAMLIFLASRMAMAWWGRGPRSFAVTCGIWLCAPLVDETIQLFTPGRAGMLTDVLIDCSGGFVGLAIAWLLLYERGS